MAGKQTEERALRRYVHLIEVSSNYLLCWFEMVFLEELKTGSMEKWGIFNLR